MAGLCKVVLLQAPYTVLTYCLPSYIPQTSLLPGSRVLIPLGSSLRVGVFLEYTTDDPPGKLKELTWPLDHRPFFLPAQLSLASELSKRQLEVMGKSLSAMIPQKTQVSRLKFKCPDNPGNDLAMQQLVELDISAKKKLMGLWQEQKLILHEPASGIESYYHLNTDPPWSIRPSAKTMKMVLDCLLEHGPLTKADIEHHVNRNVSSSVVRNLLEKGLIALERKEKSALRVRKPGKAPGLTREQQHVCHEIITAVNNKNNATFLLHGITGSGKTRVYLEAALACLESGRSVYLLCPEVALAYQLWKEVEAYLSHVHRFFYHGYQSPAKRHCTYTSILQTKEPLIVVGTRSVLFLPVENPGLLILDEEHDTSFKQDERLVYQAKELAFFLAQKTNSTLVLGSATPDIKTYFASEKKLIQRLQLPKRISDRPLPEVTVVDLTKEKVKNGPFSHQSITELTQTLEKGNQAIILQNRRGYAPLVFCPSCGQVAKCSLCDVGLTFHKSRQKLLCHYCGLQVSFPQLCGGCGECQFLPLGEGTEQVEEWLSKTFPGVEISRLDRDTTRKEGNLESVLKDFAQGKKQVLVGTQMISKGHDFPGVTFVGVVDGDLGLNLPDYRATEKTFQLLVQVSGRAGRGDSPGKVMIQTRNPDHYCWKHIKTSDYQGFYHQEVSKREKLHYPPFVKLGLIRLSFPEGDPQGTEYLSLFTRFVHGKSKGLDIQVLGPAPSPLEKIRKRLRYQCVIKGQDWGAIRFVYSAVREGFKAKRNVRLALDLDPVSML